MPILDQSVTPMQIPLQKQKWSTHELNPQSPILDQSRNPLLILDQSTNPMTIQKKDLILKLNSYCHNKNITGNNIPHKSHIPNKKWCSVFLPKSNTSLSETHQIFFDEEKIQQISLNFRFHFWPCCGPGKNLFFWGVFFKRNVIYVCAKFEVCHIPTTGFLPPDDTLLTNIQQNIFPSNFVEFFTCQNWNFRIWNKIEWKLGLYFSKFWTPQIQWISCIVHCIPKLWISIHENKNLLL